MISFKIFIRQIFKELDKQLGLKFNILWEGTIYIHYLSLLITEPTWIEEQCGVGMFVLALQILKMELNILGEECGAYQKKGNVVYCIQAMKHCNSQMSHAKSCPNT